MDDQEKCHVEPIEKEAAPEERAQAADAELFIWGMGCINCANRIRNSLLSERGVITAQVDHLSAKAYVKYNPTLLPADALLLAVARAGNDGRHNYRAALL